jgi:ABC-2 type transport system ATP-binding protein
MACGDGSRSPGAPARYGADLDEPSTGLDPGARRDLWQHLHRLRGAHGVTVLLTTHLMDEAEHCDRLLILDRGLRVALESPAALKEQVGGDVVTVDVDSPEALAVEAAARFAVKATVVGGRVRVERERGHELAAALVEAFPGRIRSVSIGKPAGSVFINLTGRRFEATPKAQRWRRAQGAAVAAAAENRA